MNTHQILKRIDILQTIQTGTRNTSKIATNCSASRSTTRQFLQDCEQESLIHNPTRGYKLTAISELILREYSNLDDKEQHALNLLAGQQNKYELLLSLDAQPTDKAELSRRTNFSRKTVGNHIDDFIALKWCEKCDMGIRRTPNGERIAEMYERFKKNLDVIEGKTEFLERYEGPIQYIPINALAESQQIASSMEYRQKVVHEVNDRHLGAVGPVRAMSHVFSAEISDSAYSDISPETDGELIVDRSVYETITNPRNWRYLFKSLQYPETDILIYPEDITIALGYNGEGKAVISAYNRDNPLHVGLFGENDAFVECVQELYEYYHARSNTLPRDLFEWAISSVKTPLSG